MIISVEGPDGCGKTSFAKELEKKTGLPIIEYNFQIVGGNRKEELAYIQMLSFVAISFHFNFIRDRHLMSNMVYASIFSDDCYWRKYLELIERTQILIAYIHVPAEELIKRIKQREASDGIKEPEDILLNLLVAHESFETAYFEIKKRFPEKIIKLDGLLTIEDMVSDYFKKRLQQERQT